MAGSWLTASAQDEVNMKFGKPTKEEMAMTTYAADPQAEAVVLCRLTDVEYTVQTSSFLVDYREKCRIKVLKPSGARFAKVVIPFQRNMSVGNNIRGSRGSFMNIAMDRISGNSGFQEQDGSMSEGVFGTEGDEMVEDVKATAFNQEGSKVVKTSLKKSDIVEKKIDEQNYLMEFTVPDVKEGTVIEYEYNIHSQLFWELHDWYAQGEIPVVFAKLDMNIPNYLIFNIEDHGIQRLTYTCTEGQLKYKVESDPLANQMWVKTNHYVYVGRDLKGMPKDDFVWNVKDWCAGITAELKQYRLRGMTQMDFAKTWEQIDEMILNTDGLGQQLNAHSPLQGELQAAKVAEIADERERIAAVSKLILDKVKWDGSYRMWPDDEGTGAILKKGTGTSADINMLLFQSLSDAGLKVSPIVLRTRDEGMMPYNFPSISKLNTFVVGVRLQNGTIAYVDATSNNGTPDALSPQLQVDQARLVAPNKKSQWVNLQKASLMKTNVVIEATLTPDGLLKGTQTTLRTGNGRESKEETPVSLQGTVGADGISFSPYSLLPLKANPFTDDQRLLPVEFPQIYSDQVLFIIKLPEGYSVNEVPKPIVVTTPDKGMNGRLTTFATIGKVEVQYQFNMNKASHPNKNYAAIKDMFTLFAEHSKDVLVAKHQ